MAIVSKPEKDNKVTLYDIPDAELAKYKLSADKATKMFPKKDKPSRNDAVGVVSPSAMSGDVQAYSQDLCYGWYCIYDDYGNYYCEYTYYPC